MSTSNSASGGTSFFTLLAILFIGLKIADVIDWSWWWVLSPIWIPVTIGLVVLALIVSFTK